MHRLRGRGVLVYVCIASATFPHTTLGGREAMVTDVTAGL